MAKPKYFEVSAVNVRGIGIIEPRRLFSLENAIYNALEACKQGTYISYDKVWRSIKTTGAYSQIVALKPEFYSIQGGLGVLIIAPESATFAPAQKQGQGVAGQAQVSAPAPEDEPITYSYRVYYAKLNHVTKKLNKTEHNVTLDASSEYEARRWFEERREEFSSTPAYILRIEPAGQL